MNQNQFMNQLPQQQGQQGGFTQQMGMGGFGGAQSMMQPGFAGTDAQRVRQDIARDLSQGSQQGGYSQQFGGQMGYTQQVGGSGGAQGIMQPGFAGTDAQQVRQDISRDLRQGSQQGGMMGAQGGFTQQMGGFGGVQSIMQPGFAGTDAQRVRQDISRDLSQGSQQGGFSQQYGGMSGYSQQAGGFGGGAQGIMQPGFAGTDVQQVRQDISRDLRQGSQQGGFSQQYGGMSGYSQQAGGFGGAQGGMMPGFAGTDAQQVRQDISRDLSQGSQQGGYSQQYGGMSGYNQQSGGFGGAQGGMMPGFAGTDVQQVRQDIARDLSQGNQQMNTFMQ